MIQRTKQLWLACSVSRERHCSKEIYWCPAGTSRFLSFCFSTPDLALKSVQDIGGIGGRKIIPNNDLPATANKHALGLFCPPLPHQRPRGSRHRNHHFFPRSHPPRQPRKTISY